MGLFLQLAIGPVFLFVVNLTFQRTILDGLVAVLAVTFVDLFYISLSIFGVGKILEKKKAKKALIIISSIILIIFGIIMILNTRRNLLIDVNSASLVSSFLSVLFLAISSPMTIIFFTGLFSAKAIEYNYKKRDLYIFGFAVGLATFIFMGFSVFLFSFLKEVVPIILIQTLNFIVGLVLICYGLTRGIKSFKHSH